MTRCPFSASQHGSRPYCSEDCILSKGKDKCLFRQALEVYIAEHSVIVPEQKGPTDEELLNMYKRIASLPIQPFNYENASVHNENYNLVDPQDYVKSPLQGGL